MVDMAAATAKAMAREATRANKGYGKGGYGGFGGAFGKGGDKGKGKGKGGDSGSGSVNIKRNAAGVAISLETAMKAAFEDIQAATVHHVEDSTHTAALAASVECTDAKPKCVPNNWKQLMSPRILQQTWPIVWERAAVPSRYAALR